MNDDTEFVVGSIWRRKRDGVLVRITLAIPSDGLTQYYDLRWETIDKPVRRGACYEDYWLRDYVPVDGGEES